jgi:DNA-binding GntR family transcriptional regulator
VTLDLDVDRTSPVPLYYQLSQQLERAIRSGELKPGDRIETEVELAQRYGLSRPTVRQAIQELVNQGLLVRRRGVGTQVVHAKMHRQVELTSLHDYLDQASHQPNTRVLTHEQVPADGTVAEALNVAEGEHVLYLRRVRLAGPEPLALMNNWLPADLDVMSDDALAQRGLYDLLRSAGVQMRVANQRIGARAATREEARLLAVKVGSPVLTMQRTTFDVAGRAFEYADHAYRSDAYSFETTLVARSGA